MSDITRVLSSIEHGDPYAAEQLLPLVYEELRKLAAQKLAQERPGQTLQATALVHEAYLRIVASPQSPLSQETTEKLSLRENTGRGSASSGSSKKQVHWDSRGHFLAAAAEAMRRILVDRAREKCSLKRGGDYARQPLDEAKLIAPEVGEELLALDEALERLAAKDSEAATLVKLRFFAGLSSQEAAETLGISPRTADRIWGYARVFLLKELKNSAK